jgi:flagellin
MGLGSINTNKGALIALQNLNSSQMQLNEAQNRISTGRKVDSAKDNGAIWAQAQNLRSASAALDAVKGSLDRAQSTVDVALSAGASVADLLSQMKEKAVAAADATLDTASRTALNEQFKVLRDQIVKTVANADFNGTNMLKVGGTTIQAIGNADATAASRLTVAAQVMALGATGALAGLAATASFSTVTTAFNMITTVTTGITNVSAALAKMGAQSKALELHATFISKLQDNLDSGVGNLVDADMAKESAKLQSLQSKQQLGIQALSIANQSTSALLGLFR